MKQAPMPVDEPERQRVLESLRILDTAPDPVLDALARSAAAVIGCPAALISFVDRDRQWFKARFGVAKDETPRASALCAHTILGDAILEVEDTAADARFAHSPLVTRFRFYAGAPIVIDRQSVGTLCVLGPEPRKLTAAQRELLRDLGKAVEHWIEGERRGRALRAADRYNRGLFEQLGHAVLLCDNAHAILDANTAAVELFGHPRSTLLQLSVLDILDDRPREWLRAQGARAVSRFDRYVAEVACVASGGRRFAAEVKARRLDRERYLVSIDDVDERNRHHEQLRQLFLAVEQSTESVVSTDLSGSIVYANSATMAMSGFSRDELIGHNARVLGSGRTPRETFAGMYAHLASGRPWRGLLSNRRKDGSEYVLSTSISPLRAPNGMVTRYVAVMKDVTEERRMAAELAEHREHLEELVERRTEELAHAMHAAEAANEAKSAFLATMSHEIRTPMNGVVGILDVLRRSPLTANQLDLVETMGESASALLGIIDDILDFSKIEAGRLTIEPEVVELSPLIESVCFNLKPIARARDVVLHMFVDPELPTWISSDPVRLRQILNNLIGNAIKFSAGSERRGRVVVRAVPGDGDRLVLTVTDNGVGIPEEAQARIFRPFEQAEKSTTRTFGGTGLGLSICKRLCDLLGGSIAVESQAGDGARFIVTLPIEGAAALGAPRPRSPLAGVHCKVVSADDEVASDWSVYLRCAGAQVETFASVDALRQSLVDDPVFICVAIVDARNDDRSQHELDALRASFSLLVVVISQGQSREPRLVEGGSVHLESRLVFRESLLKAVAMATGFEGARPDEPERIAPATPAAQSVAEAERAGQLILVAEDNRINQKVIRTQLDLLGYTAEMVDDGVEALAAWRTGRFALLLTDLHMPTMDGYELATQIRAAERPPDRIPIIALTANILRTEGARCRDVGMDECMTKPVQLDALNRVLAQYLPPRRVQARPAADAGRVPPLLPALDSGVLARLIGDDPAVIDELLNEFRTSMASAAVELEGAVRGRDRDAVASIAHRLKASARAVGALALGQCCDALEAAARAADPTHLDAFRAAVSDVATALSARPPQAARTAPQAFVVAERASSQPQPPAVVVLDDDPADIERTTAQLASNGIVPAQVWSDGSEALAWLRHRDTASLLLLLDLQMPGMDGIDFMRRLAEQGYEGALAIVSGADSRVLETAAKLGEAQRLAVLGHFRKPLSTRRLQGLLAQWHGFVPRAQRGALRKYTANEVVRGIIDDEMVLYYQPKVSLVDGALMGVEALVRWQHPVDGLVAPSSFVGVVEAHGGIDMLTGTVMSLALAQARAWNDAGTSLCIAINVSMVNLLRIDFPELLLAEAERHGVPFTDIRLEVTESRLMSDLRSQIGSLARLKLNGTGLSIDDFGTGHSSLAQLRDIPFDELKIDQSFVHGAASDATRRAIFSASLGMAHDLGMTAVAEGVEDRDDWDFMRASGVDLAQGYFIARPMPAADIPAWAVAWAAHVKELL